MRLKPDSHITIEFLPYTQQRVQKHKHGCTHLVRVTEREAVLHVISNGAASEFDPMQPCKGGKILNIFEQEICSGDDGLGIANTLRRLGDWQRAPRTPAKRRTGVYQTRAGKIQSEGFETIGGGHGSRSDYREA